MNETEKILLHFENEHADNHLVNVDTIVQTLLNFKKAIQELDMSPFYFDEIIFNGIVIKFKKTLVLEPSLDDTKQLICLKKDDICIDVYASTRNELEREFQEQMRFLWEEYANCDESEMTSTAKALKNKLLSYAYVKEQIDQRDKKDIESKPSS